MSTNYDELAERAERGELALKPGSSLRGAAAAEEARRVLMAATGAASVEDVTRIALGRPSAGSPGGESPVVRARVPWALKARVAALAKSEHRKESDVVRDALAAYVEVKAASSGSRHGRQRTLAVPDKASRM